MKDAILRQKHANDAPENQDELSDVGKKILSLMDDLLKARNDLYSAAEQYVSVQAGVAVSKALLKSLPKIKAIADLLSDKGKTGADGIRCRQCRKVIVNADGRAIHCKSVGDRLVCSYCGASTRAA